MDRAKGVTQLMRRLSGKCAHLKRINTNLTLLPPPTTTPTPPTTTMLFGRVLALLTLLSIGTWLSNAQCAVETAAILSSPNVTEAYAQLNQDIIGQVQTCVSDGNEQCDVSVDTSGVEQACVNEGGTFSNPNLDIDCTNSKTGLATIVDYEYVVCVGANCTEAGTDIDSSINDALDNITAKINDVLSPDGIECSAMLVSGASKISVALMMLGIGLVTFISCNSF